MTDIDPEEMVLLVGVGTKSLRTLVIQTMARPEVERRLVLLYRDPGKTPAFFNIDHIEELSRRADFQPKKSDPA